MNTSINKKDNNKENFIEVVNRLNGYSKIFFTIYISILITILISGSLIILSYIF
jgi:hypothetical protein